VDRLPQLFSSARRTRAPFAVEGKATLRQLAEANFANTESVTFSPINPQCRVIGSTGIVWGHTALTRKPKDGPLSTLFARFMFIFAKADGQWREGSRTRFATADRRLRKLAPRRHSGRS
jgi:ketosteroid isomerase-like protein